METYEQIVMVTKREIDKTPEITDDQLLGFVQYLGVFVPHMKEAREELRSCDRCGKKVKRLIDGYCKKCDSEK